MRAEVRFPCPCHGSYENRSRGKLQISYLRLGFPSLPRYGCPRMGDRVAERDERKAQRQKDVGKKIPSPCPLPIRWGEGCFLRDGTQGRTAGCKNGAVRPWANFCNPVGIFIPNGLLTDRSGWLLRRWSRRWRRGGPLPMMWPY